MHAGFWFLGAAGLAFVGYKLLMPSPSSSGAQPRGAALSGGYGGAGGVSPGQSVPGRQFTAGPLSAPVAPGAASNRPDDLQSGLSLAGQLGATLPSLVTAIGTQENESTRISNAQQLALMDRQKVVAKPNDLATSAQSKVSGPQLTAPVNADPGAGIFAASDGRVDRTQVAAPDFNGFGGYSAWQTPAGAGTPGVNFDTAPPFDPTFANDQGLGPQGSGGSW